MRNRLTTLTAAACTFVLVLGLVTASYLLGANTAGDIVVEPTTTSTADSPPPDLATVGELYERITSGAVDAPDDEVLVRGAIEGMLETLDDPYALYYDAEAFAAFNQTLDGRFSGVGLLLEEDPEEGHTVVRTIPETPAAAAGIEPGERIVSVDGRDVTDLPLSGVVELVIGDAGTDVVLGIEGDDGVREVRLTRAEFEFPTVTKELLDDDAGLISLASFTEDAAEQVQSGVDDLLADGAKGIILDLRRNPGGLLNEAVDVTGVFVEDEVVVTVRESDGEERPLAADASAPYADVPLVVLVDQFSASASEIVAAAMQDTGRAELVGTTTFGKGTVQTVRRLSDGSGVKFTTAEYLTPSGVSIEGTGVVPDTEVQDAEEQLAAAQEVLQRAIARAGASVSG